jgi:hypothetical protein
MIWTAAPSGEAHTSAASRRARVDRLVAEFGAACGLLYGTADAPPSNDYLEAALAEVAILDATDALRQVIHEVDAPNLHRIASVWKVMASVYEMAAREYTDERRADAQRGTVRATRRAARLERWAARMPRHGGS